VLNIAEGAGEFAPKEKVRFYRMARRSATESAAVLDVCRNLKLLADEPRHGYELIKAIEELTEGSYAPSPGTIYPTLALLEDEGAITQAAGDETRKAYEATAAGRTELEERADEVAALFARLSGHGEHRRAYATPEMFRAVGNLANVLKNRARSGKLDEETVQEIVDLVDDLAKKIERL